MRVVLVERGAHRVGQPDLDVRLALAERDLDAGERAARADGADEAVDPVAELLPELGRRGIDVRLAVGDVVELVGPDGAVRFLGGLPAVWRADRLGRGRSGARSLRHRA